MNGEKPKILILSDFYLPGYKSGALRTIVNMVERMSDEFDFRIVTGNRDSDGDASRFSEIRLGEWQSVGNAQVFYAASEWFNFKNLRKLISETAADAIYLNSFFSPLTIKFLTLRRFGKILPAPVVLAPEGEFSKGAIQLKAKKKQLFLKTVLPVGLYKNLVWKAVSDIEKADIIREIGERGEIMVAANMPPRIIFENFELEFKPRKSAGELNLIFLSRISPKKNLKFALELLKSVNGRIHFDVFGSLEDEDYWAECQKVIREMPENVSVNFLGSISYDEVAETFSRYHFFLFPTSGENFGHVVIESLAGGTPVLLSDQTPWQNLKKHGAGWVIPLAEVSVWEKVLQNCADMSETEFLETARKTREYALSWLSAPEIENANREVLRRAVKQLKS